MSEKNVEVVRRILEAFSRRDRPAIEAELHQEATWYPALHGLTERSSYNGPEKFAVSCSMNSTPPLKALAPRS